MEFNETISPLHERRRRKDENGPVNFSQIRRPRPLRTDLGKRLSSATMAPQSSPETPKSPHESTKSHTDPSLFHNYLRAFCQFEPPSKEEDSEEALLMTVAIRPGDLILVHSVHQNGWADGTVLTTGARGWLPTNYCENFDHPYLRNLLNAMTQFWDLLGAPEDANLSTFVRQDYIRGLIAGVRYLLEHADCLHRDASLVQRNTGIRRMRKGLLADLSTLVSIAKRLQETISEPFAGEVVHVLLDDLIAKAFKVVTRAVGFVDILAQEAVDTKHARPTRSAASTESQSLAVDTRVALNGVITHTIDSAIDFPSISPSKKTDESGHNHEQSHKDAEEPQSPTKFRPRSGLVAHRLSLVATERSPSGTLASEQLARAHDRCISHIGAFIGLYLHARPSSELMTTTERLVKSCEEMLAVLDQIFSHDSEKTSSVQQARVDFRSKLDELTKSTEDVFKFSDGPDDEVVMLPEQSNHLVNVGTSLIRTVGECVFKTRKVIEQVGDFDLQDPPVNLESDDAQATPGSSDPPEAQPSPSKARVSREDKRLSQNMPPPPPPPLLRTKAVTTTDVNDFAPVSPLEDHAPDITPSTKYHMSLAQPRRSVVRQSQQDLSSGEVLQSPPQIRSESTSPTRKGSVGRSIADSTDTHHSSIRDSAITAVSEGSTRATTPDHAKDANSPNPGLVNSFDSLSSLRSAAGSTDASIDTEAQLLQRTYANELTLNKDGQVTGGSLPALVEQLTTHDSAPDAQFLSSFFLTFRAFTTPRELAQTLTQRFDYIGDTKSIGTPVRLRIYNVFKGWLETYWNVEADRDALGDIRYFALHKLKPLMPQPGDRLIELTRKVSSGYHTGTITGPLVSGVGKTSMSIGSQYENESKPPEPIIAKNQLSALRNDPSACHITDFDPLEVARQLTLLASKVFCEIVPEELLSLEWNKKNASKARNVRNMCSLNTDLAHVVGDTILGPDDMKKRAAVIKHWSKIAVCCLELSNYESLMAIMCSLNSSVVQRLRRTWDIVSKKSKARLSELNGIVDFSRNQASLRRRLEQPVAPCLPFLGIYLTDLTFVDAGNPKTRELPSAVSDSGEPISVINFDKYMRMARIVGHVQKFQVPYKLTPIPELQSWMDMNLQRMREGSSAMVGNLHRRSLVVEPKDVMAMKQYESRRGAEATLPEERPKTAASVKSGSTAKSDGLKFELFFKTHVNSKTRPNSPTREAVGLEERKARGSV